MEKEEFLGSATSTAMKKVFKAAEDTKSSNNTKKKKLTTNENDTDSKKQKTISQFFTRLPK
ncbi:hypothetical protein SK128_016774 [Halocaridina rubra]|uniref:Uncharacterized protein n=1 Tax=Halocaridina rubra TaxID=373956 RepID=A0AAN8XD24_HALRR